MNRFRFRPFYPACLLLLLSAVAAAAGTPAAIRSGAEASPQPAPLHFHPDGAKAGDVIPFFWQGQYHVFYLNGPDWGHRVSADLLNWRELPLALRQGADSLGPDGEAIWTGSIVERDGMFYLFYTGKNSRDPKGDQKVMQARSPDLVHWTKCPEYTFYADGSIYWSKPVNGPIDDRQIYHHQAFRDPHVVWNPERNEWWLALHAVLSDGSFPVVGLYSSQDLTHWKPRQPLIVYPASVSGDCPDLFALDGRWNVNCADYHYMQVDTIGTRDPEVRAYDCGDLRVAKTMWDGRRRILLGWIGDYAGGRDSGAYEWGGVLSMPREQYTGPHGVLYQRPAREIVRAFGREECSERELEQGRKLDLPQDYMLIASVDPKGGTPRATFRFRQDGSPDAEGYRLTVDFETQRVELGSRYRAFGRVCGFDPSEPVRVRLFVVGTVAECFVNDAYCFTMRIYDGLGPGFSFESDDSALTARHVSVRVRDR